MSLYTIAQAKLLDVKLTIGDNRKYLKSTDRTTVSLFEVDELLEE